MGRRLVLLWLALLASGASPLERAVPVTEETLAPDAANASYARCDAIDLSPFAARIAAESNACAATSTYRWSSAALPTTSERRALCDCSSLIAKLHEVAIPRCSLVRDDRVISYAQLVQYAFGLCSPDGGSAATTNTNATVSPASTSATPSTTSPTRDATPRDTAAPTVTKSTSKGAIGASIGGVAVVIAITVFATLKCSQPRHGSARSEPTHASTASAHTSPLDDHGDGATYRAVPSSPRSSVNHARNAIMEAQSTPGRAKSTRDKYRNSLDAPTGKPQEMGKWEDHVLLAVRVPYDTVFFGPLLSRGGYGEVYKGTYQGETVAIKQLLPERRKDLTQIEAFLSEIKLMSTLEHERIIKFVGVAWQALSDTCVIVEYMDNGDLRSVLTRWDRDETRPQGFDADKTKIALHVAHALTYLHSLQPVVVHRDLKSKNILLDANYDAKLTDFGVSRERADATMTAGVGSSLWMAPEVMLGERYDEKADVFSFGVVLSELDTQKLPYDHAKETGTDRKVADSAILQMVSLGRLEIAFTEYAHPDLVQLGRDCVQLDSKKRPTSAEVLHRVHLVLRNL